MKKETEDFLQQQFYIWYTNEHCRKDLPKRGFVFSIVNEGMSAVINEGISQLYRASMPKNVINMAVAILRKSLSIIISRFKLTGYTVGVNDMIVGLSNGKTLYFEFKTTDGVQSKVQKEFQERVEASGNKYFIVRSLEQAKEIVNVELSK